MSGLSHASRVAQPLFLRRTLAYSKQQRRKQEGSRVDGAKRRVLLAEDVLGVKPFIDAGLCPILGCVRVCACARANWQGLRGFFSA